jgi:hypothetical protein
MVVAVAAQHVEHQAGEQQLEQGGAGVGEPAPDQVGEVGVRRIPSVHLGETEQRERRDHAATTRACR